MYQMGWGILRNGLVVLGLLFVPTLEMFFIWQISTVLFALLFKLALQWHFNFQYRFDFSLKIEKSVFKRIWGFASGMLLISLVAGLNTDG
jgi:hypothetical protein